MGQLSRDRQREPDTDRAQPHSPDHTLDETDRDDDRRAGSKRRYHSPRRAEQAAVTRNAEQAAVTRNAALASARELFVSKGYAATTVADIARHARVAVDTVYATVGRKPALLRDVLETSISGTDNAIPARQRDYVRRVSEATTARDKIAAYVDGLVPSRQRHGSRSPSAGPRT
jgi:AcrR family transcriptional regulator